VASQNRTKKLKHREYYLSINHIIDTQNNEKKKLKGGISSGQTIRVAIALKPTASITTPGKTININREDTDVLTKGRHDPCVGVRAAPIAEAMLAIVLMDHFLRHRAQNADVVAPFAPIEY